MTVVLVAAPEPGLRRGAAGVDAADHRAVRDRQLHLAAIVASTGVSATPR